MSKIKYIKHTEKLCLKCLKEHEDINSYILYMRGYGSKYDSFASKLQLCDECSKESHDDLILWFNEQPTYEDKYIETYKYEDNISSFIESLPIQGREIFENHIAHDYDRMESQDWIDIELGIASNDVLDKYGLLESESD